MFKRVVSMALAAALAATMVTPLSAMAAPGEPTVQEQSPLALWYDEPATDWESQALPLGNGFMGAMVFGGVESDQILVNEHTLWSGGPGADENYDGGHSDATQEQNVANLKKAQELLQEAVTDFSENHAAYIDPETGQVVSSDYQISGEVTSLINSLKGDKSAFGSYEQLSNIMVQDGSSAKTRPSRITSNSANADSQNQEYQEGPEKAFDGSMDTKWYSTGGLDGSVQQEMPVWIKAEYSRPLPTTQYAIVSGNDTPARDPKSWTLYGSNNDMNYKVVDTQKNVTFDGRKQTKVFQLDQEVAYRYYKLEITELSGDASGVQMQEIILDYQDDSTANLNYKRSLDLDNAVANVQYTLNDVNYNREYFVSNPDNIIAVRMTADQPGSLSKNIYIDTPQRNVTITAEGDTITMVGQPSDQRKDGLHFAQQIKVIPTGGTMMVQGNRISVFGADEVVLLSAAGTNYQQCMDDSFDYFSEEDPLDAVSARIAAAVEKGYDQIKADHIADYKELFDAMKLNLGYVEVPDKPTDELLAGYNGRTNNPNTADEDLYLETMFYQYGRYLMIASSREGSLPANLQGIWASGLNPPWDADYHTNINLQMNYWPAEQTNLEECHEPMITYINSLVPRGSITAKKVFGEDTRGWTTFHENNIWGNTAPAVSDAFWTPTAAGWLVQDIWEDYAFNMDEDFLAENYDTMLQSALFLLDILVEDSRDGTLVVSPSYSPEHGPYSLGSTFDQAVVWDVFNNVILASDVLGKSEDPEVLEIKDAIQRLSGPKIGLAGQFQEWKDETTLDITGDGGHRHVNHLYGLHPGKQIVAGRSLEDDAYVEAMKETLTTRGDGGTGWSKAWKINFWARLRDGDHAHKMLEEQLKESTLNNLFDTHSPFQIDGNFGATSGVAEMLLQSQGDSIDLLAALPAKWADGSFTGLKARGNFEISAKWSDRVADEFTVKANVGGECRLRYDGLSEATVTDSKGNPVEFTVDDNNTIIINSTEGEVYTITNIPQDKKFSNPVSFMRGTLDNIYSQSIMNLTGMTTSEGAYIAQIPDGSAISILGMQQYDVVTEINGTAVTDTQQFISLYDAIEYGSQVTLKVWRQDAFLEDITFTKSVEYDCLVVPAKIEAEDFDEQSGVQVESCGEGGQDVGYIENGDYVVYKDLYFQEPIAKLNFRHAGTSPQAVTVRLDSLDGPIVAQFTPPATSGWQNYTTTTVDLSDQDQLTGKHDLYFCFGGGININWFELVGYDMEELRAEIQGIIQECEALPSSDYTQKSYEAFMEVVASVKESITDESTVEDLIGFKQTLVDAKAALVPVPKTEKIDDTDSRIQYTGTWQTGTNDKYYNGSQQYTTEAGGSAQLTFTGTGVAIYTEFAQPSGIQNVYLDGELVATVDTYDSGNGLPQSILYENYDLPYGKHTIRAEFTGETNPSAMFGQLTMDAIQVVVAANKTSLKFYLDKANAVDSSVIDSLVESAQAQFTAALERSQKVYDNPLATQEEVDAAAKELRIALNMLGMEAGDKEALIDLIAEAEDLLINAEGNYPMSAIDALQKAIEAAQAVVDGGDAFQADVDKAVEDLQNAMEAFQNSKLDWRALEAAVADGATIAADIEAGRYVEDETISVFQAAYEIAQNTLANKASGNQITIDAVTSALLGASANLRYKADKTTLEAVIGEAGNVDVTLYTAESVATFRAAFAAANTVLADDSLSVDDQAVVDDATATLEEAMAALVPIDQATADGGDNATTDNGSDTTATKTGDSTPFLALAVLVLAGAAGLAFRKKED